jgi:hypothetical protein
MTEEYFVTVCVKTKIGEDDLKQRITEFLDANKSIWSIEELTVDEIGKMKEEAKNNDLLCTNRHTEWPS